MTTDNTSSSGEITSSFESISDVFTTYAEIPSQGFNRLFKAQRYGKWFVLKGLKPEYQGKAIYNELLTKEFELGVQLDHPNITRIFSKESCDPVAGPCVVMEYVDGCTLKEFLKRNPSGSVRMKIAKEILAAMAYYHSKQIIHRDLKPDNILITNNGHNVKIIDFGLADSDWHGILKQPAGSDKYAAPEQVASNVPLDCRADIYAFGVILQQLFPHGYGGIVRKCTQPDRERRFGNAEEVLQRLKRRKSLFPAIFIPVLLCVAAAAWLLWSQTQNLPTESIEQPETDVVPAEDTPSDIVAEPIEVQVNPASKEEVVHKEISPKEADKTSDDYIYRQIPAELRKSIEQSVDTLFRRFWNWNRAAESRGMSPIDKLAEYTNSDFFKNNYDIRERHREAVVSDLIRRYPQCEPAREQIVTYYNSLFVKRMVAVNNVVYEWQKAAR
jgi:Serine/threonine protein kinase